MKNGSQTRICSAKFPDDRPQPCPLSSYAGWTRILYRTGLWRRCPRSCRSPRLSQQKMSRYLESELVASGRVFCSLRPPACRYPKKRWILRRCTAGPPESQSFQGISLLIRHLTERLGRSSRPRCGFRSPDVPVRIREIGCPPDPSLGLCQ